MPTETMTGKERWRAVLTGARPDRTPMDYWATPEATARLCTHLGCDFEMARRRLHIDDPLPLLGRYMGPPLPADTDPFGVRSRPVHYDAGVYREAINAPLAGYGSVAEIEANYTWPEPDWWDYAHLPGELAGKEDRCVRGGHSEPLLRYMLLRGQEQGYMDLLVNPDIVQYCLGKLFDLAYQDMRRIFETVPGVVDISYVAEDLGGQSGLLYSMAHIRAYLLPGMKRMMDLVRQHGSHVFVHSDGAVREVIPDLIEIGMEVLNPIQWVCPGMDRAGLKRDFGAHIAFHGAVDNQHTLPFGGVADVRREVLDNLRLLGGEDGRYILGPCHNIQAVSPPENVVALYETGYAEGWR